jgi:hypothetical protein
MASRDGASGDFRLGLMKHWLKEQAIVQELVRNGDLKCSVNPPEFIEFIDTLGNVDKMYQLPNRKNISVTSPRQRSPAPPSPPKLNPLSSSEVPSRKDKGKARDIYISQSERNKLKQKLDRYKELHRNPNSLIENPLSTLEEDEFIKKLTSEVTDQIRGVMSLTETPRLDYVINQALAGDTWYSKPDNDETIADDWFKGLINDLSDVSISPTKKNQPSKADKLVKSKPLPSSSNIKKKNKVDPIFNDAHKCAIVETIGREVRMAERYAIQKGDSFTVNLQMWGHVKHSKQNPLWEVPGFCYLAAINIAIPCDKPWPANPTVQQMSRFGYKYRKLQSFKLIETIRGQHYTLTMDKPTIYRDNSGWRQVDYLARNNKFYMRVGGDGDKSDVKILDGTNYQQWAPKMQAYLKSKELWYYINGVKNRPSCIPEPVRPVPAAGSTTILSSDLLAYDARLKTYN